MRRLHHLRKQLTIWLAHAWQNGTFWFGLALLLLLPVWFNPTYPMQSMVSDTLFVIDVSESMNVPDVSHPRPRTARLALAKNAVLAGMASLPCGSKVSVGLFAGEEVVVLFEPLEVCSHYPSVERVVTRLNTHMRWIGDSWLIRGMINGIKEAQKHDLSLVFITDADEMPHRTTPRIADLLPYQGKVKAALWGVGGETPLPVPKVDAQGNTMAYWTREEAVIEGNYPNLLGYVKYLGEGESAPAGALDEVSEHLSAFNKSLMQSVAQMLKVPYQVVRTPKDGLQTLNQAGLQKQALAQHDVRWLFGLAAIVSVMIGWFWQPINQALFK